MIKSDFIITPQDEKIRTVIGKRFDRIMKSERNRRKYENVKRDLITLTKPLVGWNLFEIKEFYHDKVILKNGIKIGGGTVVPTIGGSEQLLVGICSIGIDIDNAISHYSKEGDLLSGVMLDGLGSWAVDAIRNQFCDWVKKDLHINYGFRTSSLLSPGESDWSVRDQKIIFELLKEEVNRMNITLNDSMLMIPLKSLTFIIGVGKNPINNEQATNCDFCSHRENCRYRHLRA